MGIADMNGNDRRCDDCLDKITAVAQKTENLSARVDNLEKQAASTGVVFRDHMVKEEAAFRDFYLALQKQGDEFRSELRDIANRVAGIVMQGMEAHQSLREEIASKYVSKQTAILVGTVTAFVAGSVLSATMWFFTNVSTKEATSDIVKQLTKEIHAHKEDTRRGKP